MDKGSGREEREDVPVIVKKEDGSFEDFMSKNRELIRQITEVNTLKNDKEITVVSKDDPWRDESEWDDLYRELQI